MPGVIAPAVIVGFVSFAMTGCASVRYTASDKSLAKGQATSAVLVATGTETQYVNAGESILVDGSGEPVHAAQRFVDECVRSPVPLARDSAVALLEVAITETGDVGFDVDGRIALNKTLKEAVGPALSAGAKAYLEED